jgi:hypothetical protein
MNKRKIISEDVTNYVLRINKERSLEYTDPSAQMARQLYRGKHPTEILVQKCMDGRLNLSVFTGTPPGIIQPFRNVGGKFDLGWPFFQEVTLDGVQYGINKGRQCLSISSYHFSVGDHHRGCAGFGYDTEGAKAAAFDLRDQFTKVFGSGAGRPVYALTIGIETDAESLIFHNNEGESLDLAQVDPQSASEDLNRLLTKLYPDMASEMRRDLLPLVVGNVAHIAAVKEEEKAPVDLEHREQIIALGRGFDWLHEPNRALIIGPYSHEWPSAVKTAGTIVLGNLQAGRIPEKSGVLLLVSALWRSEEREVGRRLKEQKVRYLAEIALEELKAIPELHQHLKVLAGVVDADTRKLHTIDL